MGVTYCSGSIGVGAARLSSFSFGHVSDLSLSTFKGPCGAFWTRRPVEVGLLSHRSHGSHGSP